MKKEYKIIPIRFSTDEYNRLIQNSNGQPVSSYIKSLIKNEGKTTDVEGRTWQAFEKKIESLNTSLSILLKQKSEKKEDTGTQNIVIEKLDHNRLYLSRMEKVLVEIALHYKLDKKLDVIYKKGDTK